MKSEELLKELALIAGKPSLRNAVEARAASRPSTTLTEDELCRQAILRLGTNEQFGPSSQGHLLAQSLYPQVRDSILLTGSWTWATKSTTLTEDLIKPEYKWGHRYALPADCLRVFRVDEYDSSEEKAWEIAGSFLLTDADSGSPAWLAARQYVVGNAVSHNGAVYRCLVAGTAMEPGVTAGWTSDWEVWLGKAVTIDYIFRETDVTKFDNLFIDLLTATLAAKLAVPLTGDAQKAQLLTTEVENLFKNPAMRRDSTERRGRIKPAWASSKLVSSRSGGDGITKNKGGGGPAGGVSYPALLIQVGSVTKSPQGAAPTVTNTGTAGTAVLNFGLPEGPTGPANTLAVGSVATGPAGSSAAATITGTAPNQTLNLTIPKGDKGDKGDAATIAVGSVATLPEGSPATVTNTGTTGDAVFDFEIPQGAAGTITVGSVTTGAAGSAVAITNTGTSSNAVLNFEIPKGDKGDAATVAVGTVTTGVAGSGASITNVGTTNDAVFNFVIPRGDAGLGAAFYSPTPPAAPSSGDLWWKTDTKQLYIFQNTNWAEVNGRNDEFPVVDLDANAYIAAVEAADAAAGFTGGLEQAVKDALTMFVVNAKLDGIWDSIKASCIMAGARSLNGALVPLKGTAPTNINFMQADYDRKTGLIGDGSNKYLNANRNNNQNAETSSHYAVYLSAKGTINGRYYLGGTGVAGGSFLYMNSATQVLTRLNNSVNTTSTTHSTGLLAVSRGNNADYTLRNNGTNFPIVQPSVAPGSFQISVFAGTGGTTKANARMSFYSIGESIDLAKLDSRISILMSQLNSAIS